MYYENPDYIYECYIEKNNLKIKRLEELKKKSEAGSIQDTYEGRLKKIESIIEGVVN